MELQNYPILVRRQLCGVIMEKPSALKEKIHFLAPTPATPPTSKFHDSLPYVWRTLSQLSLCSKEGPCCSFLYVLGEWLNKISHMKTHFEWWYISTPASIQDRETLCRSREASLAHTWLCSPLATKALGAVDLSNCVVAAAPAKPCLVREDQAHHLMQPD